jgi:hypothetical protein
MDHGLQIKPVKGSIQCHGSKEVTFTAAGGKPPYKWKATLGVLAISGDKQESAKLSAGTNPGSAVLGSAYRVYRGAWNVSCAALLAVFQDFKCDDTPHSACAADATDGNSRYPCEGLQIHPCQAINGGMPPCDGNGPNNCFHGGCTEFDNLKDTVNGCTSCSPAAGGEGRLCDSRTPQMILDGCSPCGILFRNGGAVTVTDSRGKSATAVVTT